VAGADPPGAPPPVIWATHPLMVGESDVANVSNHCAAPDYV
jgi:hypothetical protein